MAVVRKWRQRKRERAWCPPRGVIMVLSNILTPLMSMWRPVCLLSLYLCFCVRLFISLILSEGQLFTCFMGLGFKDSSHWHCLWRKDNVWWSEPLWLSKMSCNLTLFTATILAGIHTVKYCQGHGIWLPGTLVLTRDFSIICGFLIKMYFLILTFFFLLFISNKK